MFVTLEATAGPVAGRKIEVRAGSIRRIGRTTKSDYAFAEDAYLSGQHFSIECDGTQCRIRDLGSSNGTFVNGNRIADQIVMGGDSVAAGGSTFLVHIDVSAPEEESTPTASKIPTVKYPDALLAGSAPMQNGERPWPGFSLTQSILLNALYRHGEPVYAVLDAVRDARIPAFLDASGEQYAQLDRRNPSSPCLVLLPQESRLLDVLIKDGWNHGWGFYFASTTGFENALSHWRSFVTLRNGNGEMITFRFWDPRVLRAVVPAMGKEESAGFFGGISRLIVEGEKPQLAVEFSRAPRGVHQQALVLV